MWVPVAVAKRKQYMELDLSAWEHAQGELFTKMEAWCNTNTKGSWSSVYKASEPLYLCHTIGKNRVEHIGPWFYFSNRNDMLMFKLKWA